jgi:RHS repeat-associated protein
MLLTEEGYVDLSASTPTYYYYLKDHQGNNRVVINSSGTVSETNHYYPFGGVFASTGNVQPYKYNGKELDTKKGLNWYDYGARHYDAMLGRFMTQDRFAEKYYALSSYHYGANNPASNVDINGDSIVVLNLTNGQHLGLLIQSEDNKWGYYSFNGVKTYKLTSGKWGGASKHNKGDMTWNTPQDFLNSDYNNINKEKNNGYGYQEGYLIPTNSEQDKVVKETYLQAVEQGYSLIDNHCSIAVQKSLNSIGIKTHVKLDPLIINASPTFSANVNPYFPDDAYKAIKMNNHGYVIKRDNNENEH